MLEKSSGSCNRLPLPASYTRGPVKTEATGHLVAEPYGLTSSSQSPYGHAPFSTLTSFKEHKTVVLTVPYFLGPVFTVQEL